MSTHVVIKQAEFGIWPVLYVGRSTKDFLINTILFASMCTHVVMKPAEFGIWPVLYVGRSAKDF